MSEPTRDDLRAPCDHGQYDAHTYLSNAAHPESSVAYRDCLGGRALTDDELARILKPAGWVKLDEAIQGDGFVYGLCTEHDVPAKMFADGSWGCWWENIVEARVHVDADGRHFMPVAMVPLAALHQEAP